MAWGKKDERPADDAGRDAEKPEKKTRVNSNDLTRVVALINTSGGDTGDLVAGETYELPHAVAAGLIRKNHAALAK